MTKLYVNDEITLCDGISLNNCNRVSHLDILYRKIALLSVVKEGDGLVGVHRLFADGWVGRAL